LEPCYKTFVSVGNGLQPFTRLLAAVAAVADLLPPPVLVQCGHTVFDTDQFKMIDFVSMDAFVRHMQQAELLILHAGAGSVMNAVRAGKRPIVMPRSARFNEVINEHQVTFAKMLQTEGKVLMVENQLELEHAIQNIKQQGITLPQRINTNQALEKIKKCIELFLNM
jgi:beta-1,4-N-acetylglucosaminyltransferase